MTPREAQLTQLLAQRDAELAQARQVIEDHARQIEKLRAANLVLQRKLDALIRRIPRLRIRVNLSGAQLPGLR